MQVQQRHGVCGRVSQGLRRAVDQRSVRAAQLETGAQTCSQAAQAQLVVHAGLVVSGQAVPGGLRLRQRQPHGGTGQASALAHPRVLDGLGRRRVAQDRIGLLRQPP